MDGKNSKRRYDVEFKREAVRLVTVGGRRISEVSRELGITESMFHRWRHEISEAGDGAFPGKGHLVPADEELRRLKKELLDVTEERDILKKALAIFSKKPR
jgi:transposase